MFIEVFYLFWCIQPPFNIIYFQVAVHSGVAAVTAGSEGVLAGGSSQGAVAQ